MKPLVYIEMLEIICVVYRRAVPKDRATVVFLKVRTVMTEKYSASERSGRVRN